MKQFFFRIILPIGGTILVGILIAWCLVQFLGSRQREIKRYIFPSIIQAIQEQCSLKIMVKEGKWGEIVQGVYKANRTEIACPVGRTMTWRNDTGATMTVPISHLNELTRLPDITTDNSQKYADEGYVGALDYLKQL